MKKRGFFTVFAAAVLCMALASPAFGANEVTEINLDVTLERNGSAYVVQTWSGSFDEGTECYFPVKNLGEITISGLTV